MHMVDRIRRWTIGDLYSLPDDGNKYELIRGQLFVTPPPTDAHETIGVRLHRLLDPYVAANGLGLTTSFRAKRGILALLVEGRPLYRDAKDSSTRSARSE